MIYFSDKDKKNNIYIYIKHIFIFSYLFNPSSFFPVMRFLFIQYIYKVINIYDDIKFDEWNLITFKKLFHSSLSKKNIP